MSLCGCWQMKRNERRDGRGGASHQIITNGQIPLNSISLSSLAQPETSSATTAAATNNNVRLPRFGLLLKRKKKRPHANDTPMYTELQTTKPQQLPSIPPIPSGKIPTKKVSFSWNVGHRHDSYEYIDEDLEEKERGRNNDGEDAYSKLDDNQSQHRYDYPSFSASRRPTKRSIGATDDPLYASTSQTYSLGSEDPYSSIISVGDRPSGTGDESSGIYEPGYSRIKNNVPNKQNGSKNDLDALYAKISRHPPFLKYGRQQPSTSAQALQQQQQQLDDNNSKMSISSKHSAIEQETESGSGSIGSQQPSYRYLTVRESPRTIRERIRRREERLLGGNNPNVHDTINGGRTEHYYSEINEYESVGSESTYGGSIMANSTREQQLPTTSNNTNNRLSNATLSVDTLRILLPSNPNSEPPRPPTSPIPKSQPAAPQPPPLPSSVRRPIVHKMEKKEMPPQTTTMPPPPSLPPAGQSRKIVNGHRSPTKDFQRHVRSVLQPLWYNGLIVHSGKGDQAEEAAIVKKPQQTFSDFGIEVETQTPQIPPSRIPVPVSGAAINCSTSSSMLRRTPSPTQDVAVQTAVSSMMIRGRSEEKKEPKSLTNAKTAHVLPAQVGKDYVSSIDLGQKRGWPLNGTMSSISSFEEE